MTMSKMPVLYRVGKFLFTPLFKFYFNPTIIGAENIPEEGPILIVGDHINFFDQFNAIISTKRFITYMAKKEYFDDKKVAWFFKATGCIPVNRSIHDENAKKRAMGVLESGNALGLFPEGTRNKTDAFLLPFKFGAVSMAKKSGAYLVPFGITGEYKFRSKNLMVRFGKPFKVGDMSLEEANDKLYKTVEKLMKQNLKETES